MNDEEIIRALAFDIPRAWATQVQVSVNGPLVSLVFRETANIVPEGSTETSKTVAKNVASVLLPADVAGELAQLLQTTVDNMAATPPAGQ